MTAAAGGGGSVELAGVEALTFDCYGTLIDWESGILTSFRALAGGGGPTVADDEVLERFGRLEAEAEAGAFRSYRDVLREVARGFGRAYGFDSEPDAVDRFAASVAGWPPFPDSSAALARLAARYRLAIVSNVDDDLFAGSERLLGAHFEHVVTAQQVRSYKPAHAHFHEVLRRLRLPKARVLHVAQSLFHDVAPANELGIRCAWVNRRAGREGGGATRPAKARPDLEVPDLRSLTELLAG